MLMYSFGELEQLDKKLQAGSVLLVPNFRSSRQLQDQLASYRSSEKSVAVQHAGLAQGIQKSPAVIAVDLWLSDLWQQLAMHSDDPRLSLSVLNSAQEALLWQRVIRESPAGDLILNISGTADSASEAWQLHLQWLLPTIEKTNANLDEPLGRPAWEIYADWAEAFKSLCDTQGVISFSAMLSLIVEFTRERMSVLQALLPPEIILHSFTSPPPLYQELFTALSANGVHISAANTPDHQPQISICSYQQQADEIRAAAQWAREIVSTEKQASIGIICSDTQSANSLINKVFRREFRQYPDSVFLNATQPALLDSGYIQTALHLLTLLDDYCDSQVLCQLLRSPWLQGSDAEMDSRAALEIKLRQQGEIQTRMSNFRWLCLDARDKSQAAASEQRGLAPVLGKALLDMHEKLLRKPGQQSMQHWLTLCQYLWDAALDEQALLDAGLGTEYRSWLDFLEQLQQNAFLSDVCSFEQAIRVIQASAGKQQMTPRLQTAPVMIMSPLAAAGMRFTHLWSLQMNEQYWPADTYPNPLLPFNMLKAHGLPDTSPELRADQARQQIQSLSDSTAAQLVFSYARSDADGDSELKPSRLLPPGSHTAVDAETLPASMHPVIAELQFAAIQSCQESTTLPLHNNSVSGGSSLLADQAACPFRAFALNRLQASELRTFQYGLSAAATGSCIHAVLEAVWQMLRNRTVLADSNESERQSIVSKAVQQALQDTARRYPFTLTPAFQQLEQERLSSLVLAWLEQELLRGDFSILATEQQLNWHYKQLQLNLRIDRLDQDKQGHTVVIDYKSGRPPALNWEAERQDLPQLMLYQQALEQDTQYAPVSALLYACVNIETTTYKGLGNSNDIYPGISAEENKRLANPDWLSLKQLWQHSLQTLAQEFLDGYHAVQPLKKTTCTYCHLSALCRVGDDQGAAVYDEELPGSGINTHSGEAP